MENKKTFDVAIIGGGPGGIYASFLGDVKGLSTVLIEAGEYLGGQPLSLYAQKAIYDYPGQYGIKGYELANSLVKQLREHSFCKIYLKTTVTKYQRKDGYFEIDLSNGEIIQSKRIIIAIGAGLLAPIKLKIPGSENCNNIEYTVGELNSYQSKKVIIFGGGDSAVDWANELGKRNICSSVSIVHRREEFRANGQNVENLKNHKVNIILNSTPLKINGNMIEIQNSITNEISNLEFDNIIVQYGQKVDLSNNAIFAEIEKNNQQRIIVSDNQTTNIDGIYAIGNICAYTNKPSSIIASHGEAARAIKDILNTIKAYDK